MAPELRKTGISVVGDLPWGAHFCTFYETKQDLLDILIPYFKTGLENNEFCLWIVSNSELITSEEAKAALGHAVPRLDQYLSKGRIEIVPHDQWWFLKSRTFDLHRVVHQFKEKLDDALAAGYVGMRVNGSPAWMRTERHEQLCEFEKKVDRLYPSLRIVVACTYPVGASTADLLFDVACSHRFTIARRRGKWDVLDTPELLQAKQQIEQLNRELEQRVRERTKELETANEKLGEEIKERKRAEEQARKVLDTIPALIGSGTPNGILDYCNQQWLAYAGVSLEELQKNETLHPDDKARVVRAWQEAMATGKPYELEQRYRRFDGVYRWFLARGVPLKDAEGVIERWYGTLTDIEDRKQAEEALRQSEAKLRQAQQLAHIGYWERDLIADRITWSKETGRILGLESSPGVSNQAQIREFIYPDDWQHHQQVLNEALQGSRLFDVEVRIVRPDGNIRFVHIRDEIVRDESGKPIRMFGAVQDITERRRAEEAVRRSEEHLRLVIDTIPTMAWTSQPDGVVDFINQRWLDYAGVTLEQYLKDPMGTVHSDDVTRVVENWGAARRAGKPYEDEMRLRGGDGEYRWFLVRSEPLRDAQGNVVKWYGSSIDIEDRKQAEEKLKHSKVQLAQAQRLAHIGSWDWDLRTNEVTWSDELYHIFGLEPGTICLAGEVDQFIHPDDLALGWETVKRAFASKEPYDYYHRILRPDGTERIARSRGAVVTDDHGEPIRVFGATQDVTKLKHAEEKLKATTEQLRALSASVQSAREEESKRIAREIHDELGGALTSWRWDLEEIRDEMSVPLDASEIVTVRNKIEVMIKLTETTLDTVRRLASELRPAALELGLVQGLEWQALQFENRTGIPVELDCVLEKVDLDNGQATAVFRILQEALMNIQRHAQATQVTIKCWEESGRFILTIKDNGRGITESEKAAHESLGLLGMRERAHLAGAELNIESAEGRGTKITVQVPISASEQSGTVGP